MVIFTTNFLFQIFLWLLPFSWSYLCGSKYLSRSLEKKYFFWSWAISYPRYSHFGDFSEFFEKNDQNLGGSGAKKSCPTSKIFNFFWTSKTCLYLPKVSSLYLFYFLSYLRCRFFAQKPYDLFLFFLNFSDFLAFFEENFVIFLSLYMFH